MTENSFRELLIQSVISETDDTVSIILVPVDGKPLAYFAGQFLTFIFHNRVGEEVRRNYSIASAPLLGEPLMITVKRMANGTYSRWFTDHASKGDRLFTIGAAGFFQLPEVINHGQSFCFFAAGSGITPIISLIKTLLYTVDHTSIVLVYSNHSRSTTIFLNALEYLKEKFPARFQCIFLFSDTPRLDEARLSISYVSRLFTNALLTRNHLYFVCGPYDYMQMVTIGLLGQGVTPAQIRKELFHVEQPSLKPLPPDMEAHNVAVEIKGQRVAFTVQYPDTILLAAKKQGIDLPYSCEAGQCGTCVANCVAGKVWMWRNDVLLEEEINNGRILTCTGYPIGGDVQLQM